MGIAERKIQTGRLFESALLPPSCWTIRGTLRPHPKTSLKQVERHDDDDGIDDDGQDDEPVLNGFSLSLLRSLPLSPYLASPNEGSAAGAGVEMINGV